MDSSLILFLLVILLLAFLFYRKWSAVYSHWADRGVPHVWGIFPFGSDVRFTLMTSYQGYTLHQMYQNFSDQPYFGLYNVRSPFLVIRSPDLISLILTKEFSHFRNRQFLKIHQRDFIFQHIFNLENEKWKTTRFKLNPAFSTVKLKALVPLLVQSAKGLESILVDIVGDTIDVKKVLARCTTDMICRCGFSLEVDTITNPKSEVRRIGAEATNLSLIFLLKVALNVAIPEVAQRIPIKFFPEEVEKFFLKLVTDSIQYRANKNLKTNDVLDLLIQICYHGTTLKEEMKIEENDHDRKIDDKIIKEIAAHCFFFFVAGFENASSMQTYCLYEMSLNPDIQKKLQHEIDETLKKHGELTYEAIKEMVYLNMVISETLRKYPILPFLTRICTSPLTLPDEFQVRKGDRIIIPLWSLHHDPQYFPDPDKFDPERFSLDNKISIKPCTYLPFGDGPRACFGMRFSQLQMKVGIITILKNYNLEITDNTKIPIPFKGRAFSTLPEGPVHLKLVLR